MADLLLFEDPMAVTLNRIEVAGFKSILQMDLTLGPLNVLIGANGAGKSNFITLFTMLGELIAGRLQAYVTSRGGPDALLSFGRAHTEHLTLRLHFGQNTYDVKWAATDANQLMFVSEACTFHNPQHPRPFGVALGLGHLESGLVRSTENVAKHVLAAMRKWTRYHFHDTSRTAGIKRPGQIGDNAVLRPDGANLAAFLLLVGQTHPEAYRAIVSTVRMVAPFFEDFALRPMPSNPTLIELEWRHTGNDAYFNAHSLSDGSLRFICLTTALLQPTPPSVVVIDEPELGLHPSAITVLAGLMRSVSQRTQIIVSTQSVTLLNQFEQEHIIVVDRDEQGSSFRPLRDHDLSAWLDEYGIGEMWEKNIFGGRPG